MFGCCLLDSPIRSHTYTFDAGWPRIITCIPGGEEKTPAASAQHIKTFTTLSLCLSLPLTSSLLLSPSSSAQNLEAFVQVNVFFLAQSSQYVWWWHTFCLFLLLAFYSAPCLSLSIRSMVSLDKLKQEGLLKPYQLSVHWTDGAKVNLLLLGFRCSRSMFSLLPLSLWYAGCGTSQMAGF